MKEVLVMPYVKIVALEFHNKKQEVIITDNKISIACVQETKHNQDKRLPYLYYFTTRNKQR